MANKKIKEKDLLAAIVTKPYAILQRNVVSDDVQKILKLYQQKGYYNAEVTSEIDFPKDPRKAVVTFNIRGKKESLYKIDRVCRQQEYFSTQTARSDANKSQEHPFACN